MKFKIGISPCPNDTFIFDAIYNKLIDLGDHEFEFIFEDVETLNQLASKEALDIIKLSYAHYFHLTQKYIMLRSGSALGYGVGPLLISKSPIPLEELVNRNIAIPGIHTTAHFLLNIALPDLIHKIEYPFSKIEEAVLTGEVDAGVIIHENRFTYKEKGLHQLIDLGEYWESKYKLPIPLGGIAIKRNMSKKIQFEINQLVHDSIIFSKSKQEKLSAFVSSHAQEMSEDVMHQHINLYVNNQTIDIDKSGQDAVEKMGIIAGIIKTHSLFI